MSATGSGGKVQHVVASPVRARTTPPAAWAHNEVAALIAARGDDGRRAYVEGVTDRSVSWADVAERAEVWKELSGVVGAPAPSDDRTLPSRPPGAVRVGLAMSDPIEMIVAFLGAVAAGFTVTPLDPGATPSELSAKIDALGLAAVVGGDDDIASSNDEPTPSGFPWVPAGIELWRAGPAGVHRIGPAEGVEGAPGGDAALVLASSGTTGAPKLIPLTVSQLLHTARSVVSAHRLVADDSGYSPLPLWHINGLVVGVLAALVAGHRLVVERRFSASQCWDVVTEQRITWLNLVPAIISVLADQEAPPAEVTARIRFARSASAPLPLAALEAFERRTGILVIETYGMTEAASQVTANPPTEPGRRTGSVGVPFGLDLRVVDEARVPVAAGTVGQIELRGPSVISEYWMPAGSTTTSRPARAPDGWLATGDLGRLDDDGYLVLVGRADDVINRGGEKVYPREIEEVILADPAVDVAAVVGRPDPTVGEVPVAFVLDRGVVDPAELTARLTRTCERRLSRFRRPAEIIVTDAVPVGPNGKIRRGDLRRRLQPPHR